jgi:uncharacterized protein YndB with AHSA1/START domain
MNETNRFTISRIFDAPLDRVWAAWTDEAHLKKWFGPKGCLIKSAKLDFKVGGGFHYCIGTPVGLDMWGKWTYRKIEPVSHLQWTHTFSDEGGTNITRHPFAPTWPLEMVLTIDMKAVEGDKTELVLSMIAVNVTDIERATWDSGFAGLNQGWGGTFDLLDEFLKGE